VAWRLPKAPRRTVVFGGDGSVSGTQRGGLWWRTIEGAQVPPPLVLAEQAQDWAEQAAQLMALYRRRFGDLEGGRAQEG